MCIHKYADKIKISQKMLSSIILQAIYLLGIRILISHNFDPYNNKEYLVILQTFNFTKYLFSD